MNYRITTGYNIPFRIYPVVVPVGKYKIELALRLTADLPPKTYATKVNVIIPVPKSTSSVYVEFGVGVTNTYEYKPTSQTVNLQIPKFTGQTEQAAKIYITLKDPIVGDVRKHVGPIRFYINICNILTKISMLFEIPMYVASGLSIRFIKLEERSKSYYGK